MSELPNQDDLSELPNQDEYAAPGSRQRVRVKKRFQRKAKKAYDLCLKAIEAEHQVNVHDRWKLVYGRDFTSAKARLAEARVTVAWNNTEQFVEDKWPVDIRGHLKLDCEVKQHGFRKFFLSEMLRRLIPLKSNKRLRFWVHEISVEEPYEIYWKVLNRGAEAERRNCIRGEIVRDEGHQEKAENTLFRGDHVVECYCVKEGVVVAKDRIHVPIDADGSDYD